MRKLFAGCLVVAVLGAVAIGVALYVGYRAARPLVDDATAYLDQARQLAVIGDRLENKTAFAPPASGELSEEQVRRLLAVQKRVRDTFGARWTELEAKAKQLETGAAREPRSPSLTEVTTMLSELGGLLLEGRRAHVDALNVEKFSAAEYSWVRLRVYEAAGLEVAQTIDWTAIEALIKEGAGQAGVEVPRMALPEIPARNRALVKPHVDELKAGLPLAVLGM
jgi:hypothetical protein